MTKKLTVEYWCRIGDGADKTQYVFTIEVRRDMWDGLSDVGRARFLQEELWENMECGFREIPSEEKTNA